MPIKEKSIRYRCIYCRELFMREEEAAKCEAEHIPLNKINFVCGTYKENLATPQYINVEYQQGDVIYYLRYERETCSYHVAKEVIDSHRKNEQNS